MQSRPISFKISGSGAYVPRRSVASSELDTLCGLNIGSIESLFGISERRWAEPDETSSVMGAAAAKAALDEAGWSGQDLDVIIGACGVMEQPIPGTSALVQRRLGLGDKGIPAFDINATCLSFLLALDRMLVGFALGEWKRGLIVCADIASAALDFSDAEASAIFGDGAVAFALEADGPHTRRAHLFRTYADGADLCRLEAGGTRLRPHDDLNAFLAHSRFRMDGMGVFKATARRFQPFTTELFAKSGITPDDISVIIPHQASAPALEHLKRSLPGGHAKCIDIFGTTGNQIATSLANALHTARRTHRLVPGTHGLLIGSSAGISLGGAIIQW